VDPANIFAAGTNSIFLSVEFKHFTKDNSLKVVWNYTTIQEELALQEFRPEEPCSGFYSFNIKISEAFPPGGYNVKVYFDEELIKSIDFLVE